MISPPRQQRHEAVAVVGATGLIGTKVVEQLSARGHRVVAVSRRHGIDILTGEGLDAALRQVSFVVDVTNPAANAHTDPLTFFATATGNLLEAEERPGVGHHVVLSIVGTDRLAAGGDPATFGAGYFLAKQAQEDLVRASGVPFTILRSTQFFEFVAAIADASTDNDTVRLPSAWLQPAAADDVARTIVGVVEAGPLNATVELAGPDRFTFGEAVGIVLGAGNDPRRVLTDPAATYFGVSIEQDTLLPGPEALLGGVTLREWVSVTNLVGGS